MISVDGSLVSMKLEASGMTFHYRTHNITTTGTVTIYCKGSKAKPQLFVRLRSMDDTKWLTNSDVTISGMAYNSVYNGWFSYAMDDTFIKTIIIPDCLYWNLGLGFNSVSGTVGDTVSIINPIVVEGTYTSETIPEYQPYFLNRPAHQYVNGEWIDIPTHKYTNNRWQGELTSQSPLKFRADGEMLDWRVEGKTSGNLYAIELGDDRWRPLANGQIISRTDGVLQIEMTSETNSGVYTLSTSAIGQLSDIRNTVSYSFDIRADTDISVLVGYEVQGARAILQVSNEWVTVKFENILFTQSYSFAIANRSSGGTVYVRNFMFNEGETALPYEPYGGVGDWDETAQKYRIPVTVNGTTTNIYTDHPLMDGDSIDYATDQTAIPIATGNNILTVDTAVKPSKVFVKFEG